MNRTTSLRSNLTTLASCLAISAGLLLCVVPTAVAADVSWLGTNGTWSNGTAGGFNGTFSNGDTVTFGAIAANNTVTISGTVEQTGFSISNASNFYTFSGGEIGGTGGLTKSGNGTAVISETTTLSYSGDTILSSGTLQYNRSPAGSAPIGTGTVSFEGGTLRLAGNASATYTISNNFTVGPAGGVINWSRLNSNPIWILNGSLSLGGNLTITSTSGGVATPNQLFNGGIFVNTDATITNTNGATNAAQSGNITGGADRILTLSSNTPSNWALTSTNSFDGLLKIEGPSSFANASGGVTLSAAPNASGLNQIQVSNNAVLGLTTNVSASDFSNVSILQRGGIRATGANGSFAQLGSDVLNYVGVGGALVLDNDASLNPDRISDTTALDLDDRRFVLVGRRANNNPTNEVIGNLTFSKSSIVNLDETNTTNSSADLTIQNLNFSPTAGNTLLIITDAGDFGLGTANSTIVINGPTKPSVTNGMITPQIQQYDGANTTGQFVAVSGDSLISASGNYTNYAGTWAAATSTQIVNVTAAASLGAGSNLSIHALRVQTGNQDLGGRTISIGSGGLIATNITLSNGTVDFGSTPGFYGAYNTASQTTISATLAGSAGLTIMGSSQSVDLNSSNTFTGGLFINGGRVTLVNANAANGNNVEVNALGELNSDVSTSTGALIGGLSGSGLVAAENITGTGNRYLAIAPATGLHTFEGRLTNGSTGKVLHILKNGGGTQVFGTNSTATYNGTTAINAGTLIVDGNFSAATGLVTVASGATLGGSGTIGGATTLNGGAILAPGNSPGILTFGSSLALNSGSDIRMEINGSSRGTTYDAIDVTGALTYGGNLQLTFGQSFGTGSHSFNLWSFGSQSGLFDSITLAGAYTGSLINNSGTWTLTEGLDSFEFSQATGSLALTVAVPEPGTWALMGIAASFLLWRRRTS